MGKITNKQLQIALKLFECKFHKLYQKEAKQRKKGEKRDWKKYEQHYVSRLQRAMKEFAPLIAKATDGLQRFPTRGKRSTLSPKQKLTLLLTQRVMHKSNRPMALMLCLFSLLSGIQVSYKTVERLYSDDEVEMALNNLHVVILRKKGVNHIDSCGDATGYTLTVRKHYASETQKRKEKAKQQGAKKAFVYTFMLMDLKTKTYVAYGTSFKSEKAAFEAAYSMLQKLDISIESIRLDRYYSFPCYVDKFTKSKVYIIPRCNATLKGSAKWKETLKAFIEDTMAYLHEYYKRNNSESEIAVDKKRMGWRIQQKRGDRVDTALFSTIIWHNLFLL